MMAMNKKPAPGRPRLAASLCDAISNFSATYRLAAIRRLAIERGSTGGLLKRIDENRELVELLQRKAPQLLKTSPWLVGWLRAHDEFFVELAQLLTVRSTATGFPRAWPGMTTGKALKAPRPRPGAKPRPAAEAFLAWLEQSLSTGALSYNEEQSAVHFTAEGVALVSPKIFNIYLEAHAYQGVLGPGQEPLKALQRDLHRGCYSVRHKGGGFFSYEMHSGRQVHCVVLPHSERFTVGLSPAPPNSSVIRQVEPRL